MASLAGGAAAAAVLGTSAALMYTSSSSQMPDVPQVPFNLPMAEDPQMAMWYSAYNTGDTDQYAMNKANLMYRAIFMEDKDAATTYQYYYDINGAQLIPWEGGFLYSEKKADYRSAV